MPDLRTSPYRCIYRTILGALSLVIGVFCGSVTAQYASDPVSVALGQSGIAATGHRAIYQNPANLMLRTGTPRWSLGFLEAGVFHNHSGFSTPVGRLRYAAESFQPFNFSTPELTAGNREKLLSQWYTAGAQRFDKTSTASLLLFGVSYTGNDRSIGVAARLRTYSTMSIGRGWFDTEQQVINRNLRQQHGTWLEISLALARELDFFTGLSAGNNRVTLGLAPKIILAGPHFDASYESIQPQSGTPGLKRGVLGARSSGGYTKILNDFFLSQNQGDFELLLPDRPSFLTEITGYGFGTDFGLSYELRLGRDHTRGGHDRVLISVAMTDLGFIVYGNESASRETTVEEIATQAAQPTQLEPTGRLGEMFYMISEQPEEAAILKKLPTVRRESLAYGLPSAIQGGVTLKYGRTTVVAQTGAGLNLQAGNTRQMHVSFGSEYRILDHVPVRGGFSVDKINGVELRFGAGIDTGFAAFSFGTSIRTPHAGRGWLPVAAGAGALHFRF